MTRRDRWSAALSALALALLALAVYTSITPIDWRVGPLRIRSAIPLRAMALSGVVSAALLALSWRLPLWRRVGAVLLLATGLVGLALSTLHAAPQAPVADAAFIELYTRHAVHGRQLLGPYSQFGWFHPGPMLFYWLAAFYTIGGESMTAINAGAVAINLLALLAIAWVGARHDTGATPFSLVFWSLVALFCARVPDLLNSAWNPHVPVLALLSLIFVAAGVGLGDGALLPILVVIASFIVQSHIGFAPTALAVAGAGVLGFALAARGDEGVRRHAGRWLFVAVAVLEIAWLLPVAEQLTSRDGNMSRIARFFFSDTGQPQTWHTAWAVWTSTLVSPFASGFKIPVGLPLDVTGQGWLPSVAAMLLIAGLVASAVTFGRTRSYERMLALLCLVACVAGFWSVLHVRALIGDYHVFWLSVIGLAGASVVTSAVAAWGLRHVRWPEWLRLLAPAVVVVVVGVMACVHLQRERLTATIAGEGIAAAELATALQERLPALGSRPVIRMESARWAVGAGILLQLDKAGVSFGVDELADLVGSRLAALGTEDVLVMISGPERHDQLIHDARVHPLGSSVGGVYADAVRFADAPEYRRW